MPNENEDQYEGYDVVPAEAENAAQQAALNAMNAVGVPPQGLDQILDPAIQPPAEWKFKVANLKAVPADDAWYNLGKPIDYAKAFGVPADEAKAIYQDILYKPFKIPSQSTTEGTMSAKPATTQRRKNKKSIEEEGQRPPGKRVSYAGYCYPDSIESEWGVRAPIGWVHKSEIHVFEENFVECIDPKGWAVRSRAAKYYKSGLHSGYCDPANLSKNTERCQYSERYGPTEDFVNAYNTDNEPIRVMQSYIEPDFRQCDMSGRMYPKASMVRIKPNDKGISIVFKAAAVNDGKIEQCTCCSAWFLTGELGAYADAGDYANMPICKSCYVKMLNKGTIHPHNHKVYQKPIVREIFVRTGGKLSPIQHYRMFGVEVETEFHKPKMVALGINRFGMAKRVKTVLGNDFIEVKEDGSLTMNGKYSGDIEFDPDGTKDGKQYAGFEIVSCPACINTHRDRWCRLEQMPEFPILRAWDTETCGLHVHVSRNALTLLQIGRILAFVNHPTNRHFIQKVAGRSESKYCKNHNKKLSDSLHPEQGNHDEKRRVAINVQNEQTIEFRIFRGTVRPCHIIRNIEFVDAMCDYCYPASRPFNELFTPSGFISFVSSYKDKWPILDYWMNNSGLSQAPTTDARPTKTASAPVAIPIFSVEKDYDTRPLKVPASTFDAIGTKQLAKVAKE